MEENQGEKSQTELDWFNIDGPQNCSAEAIVEVFSHWDPTGSGEGGF